MKEVSIRILGPKQQETLTTAKKIADQGIKVTATTIAQQSGATNLPVEANRVRQIITKLKHRMMWPYNQDGMPGFRFCNVRLVYEGGSMNGNPDLSELDSDEWLTLPEITPESPAITKVKQSNRDFVDDLMEIFWMLPEDEQNRLWPSVASLISRVIEPHH